MADVKFDRELKEKIFKIFNVFMARVAMLEELRTEGSKLLSGFQQGLELLRRPAIDETSNVIKNIIAKNSKDVRSYFKGGCITPHDGVRSATKLQTCRLGLDDHLKKAKSVLDELGCLVEDVTLAMQTAVLDEDAESNEESNNLVKKSEMTEYAWMMGIINYMIKKDYEMQEKIICGLNAKSSSGELESYCLMWSLCPFMDEEFMGRAWKLIK